MPDKKYKNCIAIITVEKDLNVGIEENLEFRIECPFTRKNTDPSNMEWFKNKIKHIYWVFTEAVVHVDFDHEMVDYKEDK